MSRLPVVSGDVGAWGTILNDFLLVAHNADGTTKPRTTTQLFASGPPSSPSDADIWIASAVDTGNLATTNGTRWMFQYNASSPSAAKWEFIGGAPIEIIAAGGSTAATTTYVDMGASFAPSRAGDFDVMVNAYLFTGGNNTASLGTAINGGVTPGSIWQCNSNGAGFLLQTYRDIVTGVNAAGTIKPRFNSAGSGTVTLQRHSVSIVPVRVA